MVMVCPYRKRIERDTCRTGERFQETPRELTKEEETFPECQGNECPFYDQRIGCRRAMKEIGYLEEKYE